MTKPLPNLLKVRKNGSQWPPSPWQVTSTGLVTFFAVTTHAFLLCVPGFTPWLVIQDALLVVLLLAAVYTMNTDAGIQKGDKFKPFINANYEYISNNYCNACEMEMPARSKHCFRCHKCVYRFDHHCFVLNNCVGASNYYGFLTVLFSAVLFLFSVAIQSAAALALYYTGHDFEPMFGNLMIDYRIWTAMLALNIVFGLAPMIEFLPIVRIQIICLHRGITQFEYFKSLSAARRAKKEQAEAEAEAKSEDIQIIVVPTQTVIDALDVQAEEIEIVVDAPARPVGRVLEPDFTWLMDTSL